MNPPTPDPNFPPRPPEPGRLDEPPVNPPAYYPGAGQPGDRGLPPRRFGVNGRPLGGRLGPNAPTWRYGVVGVFLAIAFFLGVFLDRAGWVPRGAASEPANAHKTFTPFWEAWNLVHEDYVDQGKVNDEKMERAALAGMLDPLGDEGHTTYLDPEEAKAEHDALQGSLEGIGATITVRDHLPTIVSTMPDSPARKAGLQPNDILVAVDNNPIDQQNLQQVVQQVRGPAGTHVKLTVHRDEQAEPITLDITRAKVEVPDVTWHMLPGEPFAHVALRSFGENADKQLRAALAAARSAGAKGVIFDLRSNPGGYKDQAVSVTSEFLKDGVVFREVDIHHHETKVAVEPGGTATDIPMVALIDGGTASAAEICVGALQDHHRAKLVGEKTFGTGTVLQPFELSDGSELLLATLEWFTPDNHQIWHKGIVPDVTAALPAGAQPLEPEMEDKLTPEALQKSSDAQLLKALELLREQVKGEAPAPAK